MRVAVLSRRSGGRALGGIRAPPAYADRMLRAIPPAEVAVDAHLVRRLLRSQHPDLSDLPVRRLGTGWDNAVFRLGRDLTVRVPRREMGARLIGAELQWLPALAEVLPLAVPAPVRVGRPSDDHPWPWAVCRYVPGHAPGAAGFAGRSGLAAAGDLARFLRALHVPAPADAPRSTLRGVPLAERSVTVASAVPSAPAAQRPRIQRAWDAALAIPAHGGPDLWVHGDLHGLNILASRGRITGIIDFGDLCAGDRATDLAVGWLVLDRPGRDRFRSLLGVGEAAWARGRGWALFFGLMFLAHSAEDLVNGAIGRRVLAEVLADQGTN